MKKATVISVHVILQVLIYGILSYVHLWGFLFTRVNPTLPSVMDLFFMHSSSVVISLITSAIFIAIWRDTKRLNIICFIVNLAVVLLFSVYVGFQYQS